MADVFDLTGVDPTELGWGHDGFVDEAAAAVSATVPLRLTAGRDGWGPKLALAYGGGVEGVYLGDGWTLNGLDEVGYYTRDGLPRYDGRDTFAWAGQELVVAEDDGGAIRGFRRGDFQIVCFRPRLQRAPVRVERWTHRATGAVHWRARHPDGSISVYGRRADGESRVEEAASGRTWRWLLEAKIDRLGNAILIEYLPDGPARYPKRLAYSATVPAGEDDELTELSWRLEVVLDYGDHGALAPLPDRAPRERPDPRRSGRAGFLQTWRYRCERVLMFHRFPEHLGEPASCVGETRITYGAHQMIEALDYTGRRIDDGVISERSLRPLRFDYALPTVGDHFEPLPATAVEIRGPGARVTDLYGEGVAGVLVATPGGAYFSRSLGDGELAPREPVGELPAQGFDGAWVDFDGDGDQELFSTSRRYFRMDRNRERWQASRQLASAPADGATSWQRVDLTGDGRSDLVSIDQDGLTYLPNRGEEGFGEAVRVELPADRLAAGPGARRLLLDLTGDGLVDLVAIDAGSIRYWPGLGHGRFGDVIEVAGVESFDFIDQFSLDNLILADVTGSGTVDFLYVQRGAITLWLNEHGERLRFGGRLEHLPFVRASDLVVADVLADGTSALVWRPPGVDERPSFLRLQRTPAGAAPRSLVAVDDGGWARVEWAFESSARQYLRDREAGAPWFERASHRIVPIVQSAINLIAPDDQLGGARSETFYTFRNPKLDGRERRFVGFLTVEKRDGVPHPALKSPATITRVHRFSGDPMVGRDGGLRFFGSGLDPPAPADLTWHDADHADALSALMGEVYQTERYAAGDLSIPMVVATARSRAARLQPGTSTRRGSFAIQPCEQLTTALEGQPGEPRRAHELTLEIDRYGVPRLVAQIGYGRTTAAAPRIAGQHGVTGTAIARGPIHIDTAERFEIGLAAEESAFEVVIADTGALLGVDATALAVRTAVDLPEAASDDALVAPPNGARARLLSRKQTYYWNDRRDAPLVLGQAAQPALVHHEREAAFDDTWLLEHLALRYDADRLRALHYELEAGTWWRNGPTLHYEPASRFWRQHRAVRSDGATTELRYDADALVIDAATNPLVLTTIATTDRNTLRPWRIEDPNGRIDEVQRDALGVVVRKSGRGTALAPTGERVPYGHAAIDLTAPLPTLVDALADPEAALAGVAAMTLYDLDSNPPRALSLTNEDLPLRVEPTDIAPRAGVTIGYFDGFRRPLQTKQRVADGTALERDGAGALELSPRGSGPRWRASGHVVFDSRQRAVREHHPFHSRSAEFEGDAALRELGATRTTHFDALDRAVRVDEPNGSYSRVEHTPWARYGFDPNDTAGEDDNPYRDARAGLDPVSDDEGWALSCSLDHAGTPSVIHLDALGREVATDELLDGRTLRTEQRLDGRGEPRAIVDPRLRDAYVVARDLLGRVLVARSIDAGSRIVLSDAFDRPVIEWTANGDQKETLYDRADRVTEVWWQESGIRSLTQQIRYGDQEPDGRDRNALGRPVRSRDEAGEVAVLRYDPGGLPLATRRTLSRGIEAPDWAGEVELEASGFETALVYDGLGRTVETRLPDGTVRRNRYQRGGEIASLVVWAAGGRLRQTILAEQTVDAFGRSVETVMGNGVRVEHTFDPVTQRLTLSTAAGMKELFRIYDAAGRLVRSRDGEQQPGRENVLRGQTVPSHRDHRYDTLGRLRTSTGRYHRALSADDHPSRWTAADVYRGTRHVNDGTQVTRYRCTYEYDDAGNLRRMDHRPEPGYTGPAWVREKWISETSNRQLPALSPSGVAWSRPEDQFDAAGRCLGLDTVEAVAWDPAGRLRSATVVSRTGRASDDERYQYGLDGKRVRRIRRRVIDVAANLVETTEVITVDGGELTRISYSDGRASTLRWASHCRGPDEQLWATLHHDVVEDPADIVVRTHFALVDERGSVTHELDDAGGLITYEEYFPYGATAFIAGDILRDVPRRTLRYVGKNQDDATGLYYFEHRYYSPFIGNWLSPDPAGPVDGVNLYQYVSGDPVNHVDPDGLCTRSEVERQLYRSFVSGAEEHAYDAGAGSLYRRIDRNRDRVVDYGEFADYLARTGNGAMLQGVMMAHGRRQEAEVARQQRIADENNRIWEEGVRQAQMADQAPQPDAPPTYVDVGILHMGGRIEVVRFPLPAGDEVRVRALIEESAALHNEDVAARQAVGEAMLNGFTLGIWGIVMAEREELGRGIDQMRQGDYGGGARTLAPAVGRMLDPIHQAGEAARGLLAIPGAFAEWSHIQSQNLVQDFNTSGNGLDIRRLDYQGNTPEERARVQQARGQAGSLHLQVLGEAAAGVAVSIPHVPDIPDTPNVPRRRSVPDAPDAPDAPSVRDRRAAPEGPPPARDPDRAAGGSPPPDGPGPSDHGANDGPPEGTVFVRPEHLRDARRQWREEHPVGARLDDMERRPDPLRHDQTAGRRGIAAVVDPDTGFVDVRPTVPDNRPRFMMPEGYGPRNGTHGFILDDARGAGAPIENPFGVTLFDDPEVSRGLVAYDRSQQVNQLEFWANHPDEWMQRRRDIPGGLRAPVLGVLQQATGRPIRWARVQLAD